MANIVTDEIVEDMLMKDDPLELLLKINTLMLFKGRGYIFRFISIGIIIYVESVCITQLIYAILHKYGRGLTVHLILFIFIQPGCGALLISAIYYDVVVGYQDLIFKSFISLKMCSRTLRNKILKQSKVILLYCLGHQMLLVIAHFMFWPIIMGKDDDMSDIFNSIKDTLSYPLYFTYQISRLIAGLICFSPNCVTIYSIYHLIYQLYILNEYIEETFTKDDGSEQHQELVRRKIKFFVKHHLEIRNMFDNFMRTVDTGMIIMTIASIGVVPTALYYLLIEEETASNSRMILSIVNAIVYFVTTASVSQFLLDETSNLHYTIWKSRWICWNKQNKNSLLILLPNSANLMQVSCFGMVNLDFPAILSAIRLTYTLVTMSQKIKAV